MISQDFLGGRVKLYAGDCLDVLDRLPANSVDAVVTDPPYHFDTIVERFGKPGAAEAGFGTDGAFKRASSGFMGKDWDGGDVAFRPETWAKVLRVLKPGGHLAAFSAPKCVHKMAFGIEAAGFEVRDRIVNLLDLDEHVVAFLESLGPAQADALFRLIDHFGPLGEAFWTFGSGFPKSHNVPKAIDEELFRRWLDQHPTMRQRYRDALAWAKRRQPKARAAKAKELVERVFRKRGGFLGGIVPAGDAVKRMMPGADQHKAGWEKTSGREYQPGEYQPATPEARQWEGWGTALKPAYEPIVIARKPLAEKSVAAQVLKTGTGGINVDGGRIETDEDRRRQSAGGDNGLVGTSTFKIRERRVDDQPETSGRFPANLTHDGSYAVVAGFPDTDSGGGPATGTPRSKANTYGDPTVSLAMACGPNSGSASRFFYTAKADAHDRIGSGHPTVKPLDLMQWLCRMLCPPGGTVLDLFAGTGTTGEAAYREGFNAILIEREAEYRADIARRMQHATAGALSRRHAAIKAKAARRQAAAPAAADILDLIGGGGSPVTDGGVMAQEGGFGFRRKTLSAEDRN